MSEARRLHPTGPSSEDLLRAALDTPASAVLKDDAGTRVTRVETGGRAFVVKHYRDRGAAYAARHRLLPSRARRCHQGAVRLRAADVPTPASPGFAEARRAGTVREAWFVHDYVEGVTLDTIALGPGTDPARTAALARQTANIWHCLGALRVVHDDLKAQNFIVDPDDRVWLIDLDGMRPNLPGPLFRRARHADLVSHFKSWRGRTDVSALFEQAFLAVAPELAASIERLRARGLA